MSAYQGFATHAELYFKYLPSYPLAYIDYLVERGKLDSNAIIADIGAGAGMLSKLLARRAETVYAIEPDDKMRLAAAEYLKDTPNVRITAGSAEATWLETGSIDLVTAGQAFHYFDIDRARTEFGRILKPGGKVALAWHERGKAYPFGTAFDALLKDYCPDYTEGSDAEWPAESFFRKGFERRRFDNHRFVDLETLIGYALSMPFTPVKGEPAFRGFVEKLATLYDRYSTGGRLELRAAVDSYLGQI